jgi:hypothetical protein
MFYLELDNDIDLNHCLEWLGRAYAKSVNKSYPMLPDWYTPGLQDEPEPTYFYVDGKPKTGGGGVIPLDAFAVALPVAPEILLDGTFFSLDVTADKKEYAQLSDAGKQALTPPKPPWLP